MKRKEASELLPLWQQSNTTVNLTPCFRSFTMRLWISSAIITPRSRKSTGTIASSCEPFSATWRRIQRNQRDREQSERHPLLPEYHGPSSAERENRQVQRHQQANAFPAEYSGHLELLLREHRALLVYYWRDIHNLFGYNFSYFQHRSSSLAARFWIRHN